MKKFYQVVVDEQDLRDFKVAVAEEERNQGERLSMNMVLNQFIRDYNNGKRN